MALLARAGRAMRSQHSERYREFLKRLRKAREGAGLTQAQVARALGRQQSFISKCESGERRVDVIELEDFARLYGKRLSFFSSRS
jgi:transcriptional regulator with XRE-family HTH domain